MEILVNKKTRAVNGARAKIGNDGENLQELLVFKFDDEFVNGQARLEYELNNTKNYITMTKVDETYILPIQSILTKEGVLYFQLVIDEGTNDEDVPIFKSDRFPVVIDKSINAVEEAPEGYEQWIEIANAKLNQIDNLDINAIKEDNVATITITKKDGTEESVNIYDGEKGDKGDTGATGPAGQDGYTPIKGIDYFTQQDIDSLNIPSKTSDLLNDSDFIINTVNNLTNYYLKNETYTKTEVQNLISAIQQFHYELVQELPTIGETNIIYLVPKTQSQTNNYYDEYVYANGWEKIGDTEIDLSNYVTITQLNSALSNYTTTNDLTTLLNAKEDKTNKVSTIDSSSTNTQYPSAKAVFDYARVFALEAEADYYDSWDLATMKKGIYFAGGVMWNSFHNANLSVRNTSAYTFMPYILVLEKDVEDAIDGEEFGIVYGTPFGNSLTSETNPKIDEVYRASIIKTGQIWNVKEYVYNEWRALFKVLQYNEQSFRGKKTFINGLSTPIAPTTNEDITNKKYVDDQLSAQIGNINTILATLTTPGGNS